MTTIFITVAVDSVVLNNIKIVMRKKTFLPLLLTAKLIMWLRVLVFSYLSY